MNATAIDRSALINWAEQLTDGLPVEIENCRIGEPVSLCYTWDEGAWGGGSVMATGQAVYPATFWEAAATGTWQRPRRATVRNEARWLQPPVTEPILYRVAEKGHANTGPDMGMEDYRHVRFVLYIPGGETEEEFKARERREFASRQRELLAELGLCNAEIKALFNSCGPGRAVNAAKLARRTQAVLGLDRALRLIEKVAFAPYGRERRLTDLSAARITWEAPTARRLNAELDGALALLRHWSPQVTEAPATTTTVEDGIAALRKRFNG
jgi:hypothetical protein